MTELLKGLVSYLKAAAPVWTRHKQPDDLETICGDAEAFNELYASYEQWLLSLTGRRSAYESDLLIGLAPMPDGVGWCIPNGHPLVKYVIAESKYDSSIKLSRGKLFICREAQIKYFLEGVLQAYKRASHDLIPTPDARIGVFKLDENEDTAGAAGSDSCDEIAQQASIKIE